MKSTNRTAATAREHDPREGPPSFALKAALLSALLVESAGFCALLIFSVAITPAAGLPGLFHYVSATWGDGLALPAMTGALVYGIARLPRAPWERAAGATAALVGIALGAATQVQWLRDDAPHLNWTLPRPHHFNAAGVYHAVFLTVMSGLTAALWVFLLLRIARVGRTHRKAPLLAAGTALAAALVFTVLLAIDSLPSRATGASTATVTATALGAALLIGLLAWTALRVHRSRAQR
ncbi:hypothetical protein [Streptomyces salinarius]|uniref:DUF998 domain-containing protein n=1 Tax=Streptomyces salinarius TaxID=2762598 RepID=A0ABW8BLW8_9ACTN